MGAKAYVPAVWPPSSCCMALLLVRGPRKFWIAALTSDAVLSLMPTLSAALQASGENRTAGSAQQNTIPVSKQDNLRCCCTLCLLA